MVSFIVSLVDFYFVLSCLVAADIVSKLVMPQRTKKSLPHSKPYIEKKNLFANLRLSQLVKSPQQSEVVIVQHMFDLNARLCRSNAIHTHIRPLFPNVSPILSVEEIYLVRQFGNFHEGSWLSDENINWYMGQLTRRDDGFRRSNSTGHNRCYFFSSLFYTRMFGINSDLKFVDNRTKRWGGQRNGESSKCSSDHLYAFILSPLTICMSLVRDTSNESILMLPINIGNTHWMLAVFYMDKKVFTLYDSLNRGTCSTLHERVINNLWMFLVVEIGSTTSEMIQQGWIYEHDVGISQQLNTSDCGVFICLFADFCSLNLPFIFVSDDIPHIRAQLAQLAITLRANFSGVAKIQDNLLKKYWENSIKISTSK